LNSEVGGLEIYANSQVGVIIADLGRSKLRERGRSEPIGVQTAILPTGTAGVHAFTHVVLFIEVVNSDLWGISRIGWNIERRTIVAAAKVLPECRRPKKQQQWGS
jgi:hypothetical protein